MKHPSSLEHDAVSTVGYSGRPLVQKLGLKKGHVILVVNAPDNYWKLLGAIPDDVRLVARPGEGADVIHLFAATSGKLAAEFPPLRGALRPSGMLWVSWPKRSSGVETDLTEGCVRDIGLRNGMVDVKVCAIDETWSGLKFVYRLKDRPRANDPP